MKNRAHQLTLPIYDLQSIKHDNYFQYLILFGLVCLIGIILSKIYQLKIGNYVSVIGFILMIMSRFMFWGKKNKVGNHIGDLVLSPTHITISKKSIPNSEIQEISFFVNDIKGEKEMEKYYWKVKSGSKNILKIKTKDGKYKKLNFLLHSQKAYIDLVKYVKENQDHYTSIQVFDNHWKTKKVV